MAKLEINMDQIKEELKKQKIELMTVEPEKLVITHAQNLKMEGKALFAFILEDVNKKQYQCRMTADSIYEEQIKKSLSRLKSIPIPPKQEEKKDAQTVVEKDKPGE
jgi:hypothetical protein